MDFQKQRAWMIERQLRTVGVLNASVLHAFQTLAREDFVPLAYRDVAYADIDIPLDHQQTLLRPSVSAQLIAALALKPTDHVLEIGTGTGYGTALLAQLALRVTSVERYADLSQGAKTRLEQLRIHNVNFVCADYTAISLDSIERYDAILLNGAVATVNSAFYEALKPTGSLVAIVGQAPRMKACLVKRRAGLWQATCLFETLAPYLGSEPPLTAFHF